MAYTAQQLLLPVAQGMRFGAIRVKRLARRNCHENPDIPPDEHACLAELRSLNVLDTIAEERFDCPTRMARRLFGVDVALVSLADENRQWFKSCAAWS